MDIWTLFAIGIAILESLWDSAKWFFLMFLLMAFFGPKGK